MKDKLALSHDLNKALETKSPTEYLNFIKSIPTPPEYISYKMDYPYVSSPVVDDLFKKAFPMSSTKIVGYHEDEYWVGYDVEITVTFPNGYQMTEPGTAAVRKQIPETTKNNFIAGKIQRITPFDYIDIGNNKKSALTLAKKNAQERFGICADVTERLVLTPEQIQQLKQTIEYIIEKIIINPRDKSNVLKDYKLVKKPNEYIKLLASLRERYDIEDIFKT